MQHPCPRKTSPLSDQVCFSLLLPQHGAPDSSMATRELARVSLPESEIIQHSHSPCLTEHFVVSKMDSFEPRDPLNANGGMLRFLHQREDGIWLAMDRRTNATRVLRSAAHFVENHIWNCYEDADGAVVAEAVASTSSYLDTYFERSLDAPHPDWSRIFKPALRCVLPARGDEVACTHMLAKGGSVGGEDMVWDYPTFNPEYKMREYRWVYAIAAGGNTSRWFDTAVKIDRKAGAVSASWSAPGIFLTEFDFVPRAAGGSEGGEGGGGDDGEDDGALITILYNSTRDESSVAVFCPRTLRPLALYPMLGKVVPFHAHGISCVPGRPGGCYTNP